MNFRNTETAYAYHEPNRDNNQNTLEFDENINNRANMTARDHLFHAMFSRLALTYDRTFPPFARRFIEFFLLLTALSALFILIYIHVAFVKSPIACLDHVNFDNLTTNESSDVKNIVIRVEILSNPPINYSLLNSYNKEYDYMLPKEPNMNITKNLLSNYSSGHIINQKQFIHKSLFLSFIHRKCLDLNLFCKSSMNNNKNNNNTKSRFKSSYLFFNLFKLPNFNPILEKAEYWREKLSVKAMAPFRQTFNELELFAKSVFTEEKYIMEYSLEYGLLRLSPKVRDKLNVPVHFILLDANKDKCFGGALSRFLLQELVGYDQIIIGSLKRLAEKQNGKGFVRNVVSGEHYRFVNSWMSRTSYLAAGFIMVIFTLSVSMLLRYSHHQIFVFIVDLLRMLENNLQLSFPAAPLLTVVLALVGMEAIMSEFFNDTSTAFYTIVIIWLADQYEAVCCRTYISKYHWPKYFYLYHFAFYAYHYRFNGQFSGLALLCSWLFIQHSMCFFFHHYELPRLLHGIALRAMVDSIIVEGEEDEDEEEEDEEVELQDSSLVTTTTDAANTRLSIASSPGDCKDSNKHLRNHFDDNDPDDGSPTRPRSSVSLPETHVTFNMVPSIQGDDNNNTRNSTTNNQNSTTNNQNSTTNNPNSTTNNQNSTTNNQNSTTNNQNSTSQLNNHYKSDNRNNQLDVTALNSNNNNVLKINPNSKLFRIVKYPTTKTRYLIKTPQKSFESTNSRTSSNLSSGSTFRSSSFSSATSTNGLESSRSFTTNATTIVGSVVPIKTLYSVTSRDSSLNSTSNYHPSPIGPDIFSYPYKLHRTKLRRYSLSSTTNMLHESSMYFSYISDELIREVVAGSSRSFLSRAIEHEVNQRFSIDMYIELIYDSINTVANICQFIKSNTQTDCYGAPVINPDLSADSQIHSAELAQKHPSLKKIKSPASYSQRNIPQIRYYAIDSDYDYSSSLTQYPEKQAIKIDKPHFIGNKLYKLSQNIHRTVYSVTRKQFDQMSARSKLSLRLLNRQALLERGDSKPVLINNKKPSGFFQDDHFLDIKFHYMKNQAIDQVTGLLIQYMFAFLVDYCFQHSGTFNLHYANTDRNTLSVLTHYDPNQFTYVQYSITSVIVQSDKLLGEASIQNSPIAYFNEVCASSVYNINIQPDLNLVKTNQVNSMFCRSSAMYGALTYNRREESIQTESISNMETNLNYVEIPYTAEISKPKSVFEYLESNFKFDEGMFENNNELPCDYSVLNRNLSDSNPNNLCSSFCDLLETSSCSSNLTDVAQI